MMNEMLGSASQLLQDGAEYIMIQVIDREPSGSSREMRIIVDNKKEECEHGPVHSIDKDRHPSSSSS